jgi:hypothetical protein
MRSIWPGRTDKIEKYFLDQLPGFQWIVAEVINPSLTPFWT